ncbi:MAG: hypothetical protein ACO3IT_09560 [Ilumatobacteraceae bacterium]
MRESGVGGTDDGGVVTGGSVGATVVAGAAAGETVVATVVLVVDPAIARIGN